MKDEKTLSSTMRVQDGYPPEHIVWEQLESQATRQLFKELKPERYYTIRMRRAVEPSYATAFPRGRSLDYSIDIGLNRVDQQIVRIWKIEDQPNTVVMKTAVQEVRHRVRRWFKRLIQEVFPV